jgi:hypothetical protein
VRDPAMTFDDFWDFGTDESSLEAPIPDAGASVVIDYFARTGPQESSP